MAPLDPFPPRSSFRLVPIPKRSPPSVTNRFFSVIRDNDAPAILWLRDVARIVALLPFLKRECNFLLLERKIGRWTLYFFSSLHSRRELSLRVFLLRFLYASTVRQVIRITVVSSISFRLVFEDRY